MYAPAPSAPKSTPTVADAASPSKATAPGGAGFEAQAAALAPGAPLAAIDPKAVVLDLIAQGLTDENELTNEVFYRLNELLRGTKLAAGSPEAKQWLSLRNDVVRPGLAEAKKAKKSDKTPDNEPESPASDDVPAPVPAGKDKASKQDAYYNQNDNSYDDDLANWAGGSAGKNTCNMTALTMALVSIAGSEAVARAAIVAYLRKKGVRSGAKAKVNGKWTELDAILGKSDLIAKVQLEDLIIAAAVAVGDSYDTVTMAHTILNIAKKTGLVKDGTTSHSSDRLSGPAVRESTRKALAKGARIVGRTKGHYVYLIEVRDDGIVVHDPAGAKVVPGSDATLWPGKCSDKLGTWLGRIGTDERRAAALRRVKGDPTNLAFMQRAVMAAQLSGAARSAEKDRIKADFPGTLELGKSNFYALDELEAFACRVGIVLEPNAPDEDLKQSA